MMAVQGPWVMFRLIHVAEGPYGIANNFLQFFFSAAFSFRPSLSRSWDWSTFTRIFFTKTENSENSLALKDFCAKEEVGIPKNRLWCSCQSTALIAKASVLLLSTEFRWILIVFRREVGGKVKAQNRGNKNSHLDVIRKAKEIVTKYVHTHSSRTAKNCEWLRNVKLCLKN